MITKKQWEKWFREELFFEFTSMYHLVKYVSRKVARNRYGILTPKEAVDEDYVLYSKFCMGLELQ